MLEFILDRPLCNFELTHFVCAAGKFSENKAKKGNFRHFWKNFEQKKLRFPRALSPSNFVNIGAKIG